MPRFDYSNNYTRAVVSFPAHKFPHTSSVYYQCNVRLCINNGGCDQAECNNDPSPINPNGGPRKKRFVGHELNGSDNVNDESIVEPVSSALKSSKLPPNTPRDSGDLSFDVYSGLYVRDVDVAGK